MPIPQTTISPDQDNYLDYGQCPEMPSAPCATTSVTLPERYTMPEDDEQQSEDEIIRPARVVPAVLFLLHAAFGLSPRAVEEVQYLPVPR